MQLIIGIWDGFSNFSKAEIANALTYLGLFTALIIILTGVAIVLYQHKIGISDLDLHDTVKPEPQAKARLHHIVADLERFWKKQIKEKDIALTVYCDPKIPPVLALDALPLHEIINTLLGRAYYQTQSGRIHLHATYEKNTTSHPKLKIIVADTGNGDLSKLSTGSVRKFEIFSLDMLSTLTERLHGNYTQTARAGKGAEFIVTLPAVEIILDVPPDLIEISKVEASQAHPNQPKKSLQDMGQINSANLVSVDKLVKKTNLDPETIPLDNILPQQSEHKSLESYIHQTEPPNIDNVPDIDQGLDVLIVEDQSSNRDVIRAMLTPLKHKIIYAHNGREAINRLKTQKFDYIIMDIHMPGLSGIETTHIIRNDMQTSNDIPIIALTADATMKTANDALGAGVDMVLTKPVTSTRLFAAIRVARSSQKNDQDIKPRRLQAYN